MNLRDSEDPQDILTPSDDLAQGLSELGTVVPERMALEYILERLPAKYHLEFA